MKTPPPSSSVTPDATTEASNDGTQKIDPAFATGTVANSGQNDWAGLRRFTQARIALGRVGASMPTDAVLNFAMAHARARDAVHLSLDVASLAASFQGAGFATMQVCSKAADRSEYLHRPDLGRRLDAEARERLRAESEGMPHRLTVVVADGLSSLAPARHALPLLLALRARLAEAKANWVLDSVVIATQARVALADEIGELRGAEAVAALIGERPGLSSPDSLGIYMTYAPRLGCMDSERNCISNVRAGGLSYQAAAYKLLYLLDASRAAGRSGIAIKDSSDVEVIAPTSSHAGLNA